MRPPPPARYVVLWWHARRDYAEWRASDWLSMTFTNRREAHAYIRELARVEAFARKEPVPNQRGLYDVTIVRLADGRRTPVNVEPIVAQEGERREREMAKIKAETEERKLRWKRDGTCQRFETLR